MAVSITYCVVFIGVLVLCVLLYLSSILCTQFFQFLWIVHLSNVYVELSVSYLIKCDKKYKIHGVIHNNKTPKRKKAVECIIPHSTSTTDIKRQPNLDSF